MSYALDNLLRDAQKAGLPAPDLIAMEHARRHVVALQADINALISRDTAPSSEEVRRSLQHIETATEHLREVELKPHVKLAVSAGRLTFTHTWESLRALDDDVTFVTGRHARAVRSAQQEAGRGRRRLPGIVA